MFTRYTHIAYRFQNMVLVTYTTNQKLHSAIRMRVTVPSANQNKFLQWLCHLNNNFCKKKLLGCESFKIDKLSTRLEFFNWWFPPLYARGHSPFVARVSPSVSNGHHLWTFHKCYLWRSPQHAQQIDPMYRYHHWVIEGIRLMKARAWSGYFCYVIMMGQ